MKTYNYYILLLAFLLPCGASAQYKYEPVFSNLKDNILFDSLQQAYTPDSVLDYSRARDTMYTFDAVNGLLQCVYTGLELPLPPGVDPTIAVYLNGIDNGINTEHTYPQSKGANSGNARSDMHHLYPTRIKTNADRFNYPFGEIPDQLTKTWYKKDVETPTIPNASEIDQYSEFFLDGQNSRFEPRERHKGDVARAMMYFYTIYREQAIAADPTFFEIQKATMCDWHYLDPVDQWEWDRSFKIAKYQDNKPNPFVLDCSLASRLYCPQTSAACEQLVSVKDLNEQNESFALLQNTVNKGETLQVLGDDEGDILILNANGNLVFKTTIKGGKEVFSLQPNIYNAGIYFLSVKGKKGVITLRFLVN